MSNGLLVCGGVFEGATFCGDGVDRLVSVIGGVDGSTGKGGVVVLIGGEHDGVALDNVGGELHPGESDLRGGNGGVVSNGNDLGDFTRGDSTGKASE